MTNWRTNWEQDEKYLQKANKMTDKKTGPIAIAFSRKDAENTKKKLKGISGGKVIIKKDMRLGHPRWIVWGINVNSAWVQVPR